MPMIYDLIIIGSGAAGLSAALYAGRYKMKTLVIGKDFGGETSTAGKIENYPGVLSIDGYDLMNIMKSQAAGLGIKLVDGRVGKIENQNGFFKVFAEDEEFQGATIILAFGSRRRHLNLPNEKELVGKGVHYCWTCDGPLYGGKTVAMVGGGDSSVKGVNFLGEYAKKIYLIARGKEIMAEPVNLDQMKKLGDKVEVLIETDVTKIVGEKMLEKLVLSKPYQGSSDLKVDGLFIEIGFDPDITLPDQLEVKLDDKNYIMVDNGMRTNVAGVFAAGDATNHFGSFKQDITASAMGAVAATSAYEYVKSHA